MTTKRLYLLPDCSTADLSGQLDAPLRSITSEHLARIAALESEPDKPLVWATGGGYSYAPITEGVPDIPERPTVTVERTEPEPIETSALMVGAIWLTAAVLVGLAVGWAVHVGVLRLWRI